ncbi:MAG: DNA polymerase, partial [Ghiorsea sp.]
IRGMLKAEAGHVWVQADYSSIENRVASWVAGDEATLQLFDQGLDQYVDFATYIFGVKYEDVDKNQRQVAKSGVLGCFGADTRVVTNNGVKAITEVLASDLLWDGEEWVQHDGVAFMGMRSTISLWGVQATPEHKVLIGENAWETAENIIKNKKASQSAFTLGQSDGRFEGKQQPFEYAEHEASVVKASAVVRTYDMLNAGSRSRYTIITDAGALVVHNSQFGAGCKTLKEYIEGYGVYKDIEWVDENLTQRYRSKYRGIKKAWYDFGDSAMKACQHIGCSISTEAGLVSFKHDGTDLWMWLPSGRGICFPKAHIDTAETPWGEQRLAVKAWRMNTYTRQWGFHPLIGSTGFFQSAVQGIAFDLLMNAIRECDKLGWD